MPLTARNSERLLSLASKYKNIVQDQWLTQVLQRDVYRLFVDVNLIRKAKDKTSREYKLLTELQSGLVFIYSKVTPQDLAAVSFLESRGFNLIDTNITFDKPIVPMHNFTSASTIRFSAPRDRNQAVELARKSFVCSRFHLDSAFTREAADTIRAEWIKNYFIGSRGDALIVAAEDEMIVGFLLLIYGKDGSLIIDLIAVEETQRRKGIATDMIIFAESQCPGFTRISVGTQLANTPSIRLYEEKGFKLVTSQYTFHYHHG